MKLLCDKTADIVERLKAILEAVADVIIDMTKEVIRVKVELFQGIVGRFREAF
jgi:hypothetical protein